MIKFSELLREYLDSREDEKEKGENSPIDARYQRALHRQELLEEMDDLLERLEK